MTRFENKTTDEAVAIYSASNDIFGSLLREVKNLSRKKPEATMSAGKVKMINRVLDDLLKILKTEPAGKYLDRLDDDDLPQMSDAVLVMVQFASALKSFHGRYYKTVEELEGDYWITEEQIAAWDEDKVFEDEDEYEEEEDEGERDERGDDEEDE